MSRPDSFTPEEKAEARKAVETARTDQALWEAIQERYGDDVILVHKPESVGYFITMSSNIPAETKDILLELTTRMKLNTEEVQDDQ
jgi:hypothetical protein